jgi:hypothetical protein
MNYQELLMRLFSKGGLQPCLQISGTYSDNTLAYYNTQLITAVKSFRALAPWVFSNNIQLLDKSVMSPLGA